MNKLLRFQTPTMEQCLTSYPCRSLKLSALQLQLCQVRVIYQT